MSKYVPGAVYIQIILLEHIQLRICNSRLFHNNMRHMRKRTLMPWFNDNVHSARRDAGPNENGGNRAQMKIVFLMLLQTKMSSRK